MNYTIFGNLYDIFILVTIFLLKEKWAIRILLINEVIKDDTIHTRIKIITEKRIELLHLAPLRKTLKKKITINRSTNLMTDPKKRLKKNQILNLVMIRMIIPT